MNKYKSILKKNCLFKPKPKKTLEEFIQDQLYEIDEFYY
jgi:hypothetical protein